MPQNPKLSLEWQKELGKNWQDIQAKYLHTIGNLTLTAHNSALGDRSFIEKKEIESGFADSPLQLNKMLVNLEHWQEKEIKQRAELLINNAMEIWSFPETEN